MAEAPHFSCRHSKNLFEREENLNNSFGTLEGIRFLSAWVWHRVCKRALSQS
jgi:hypothetical protein